MGFHTLLGARRHARCRYTSPQQIFKVSIKDRNVAGWKKYADAYFVVRINDRILIQIPKIFFPVRGSIKVTGEDGVKIPKNIIYYSVPYKMEQTYNMSCVAFFVRISDRVVQLVGDRNVIDIKFLSEFNCDSFMLYMQVTGGFLQVGETEFSEQMGVKMFKRVIHSRRILKKRPLEFIGNFNYFRLMHTPQCAVPEQEKDMVNFNRFHYSIGKNINDTHIIMHMIKKYRLDFDCNVMQVRKELNDYSTTNLDELFEDYQQRPVQPKPKKAGLLRRMFRRNKRQSSSKDLSSQRMIWNMSSTGPKTFAIPLNSKCFNNESSKKQKRSLFSKMLRKTQKN
ncbi:hypothetical protein RDWZM_006401 [Blomia tropicalis]|uniref:Uncharacterized protein n=1 Tax=Blomia tropicalis TaxID=40697 RepID=A0A9Q0M802_BLOTA|nr:hypothetical protein RDWZM_006401 [Blomia tropicalis]